MSTKTQITCHCGQRIQRKDVLQQGRFLRVFSPSFIYVKYRCSRCKRLGERFLPQEQWDDGTVQDPTIEVSSDEQERFSSLGTISIDEVVDFHFQMENLRLSDLLGETD
jgi:DNA-directed RNA polymerase subunit RPC12/RpoP